VSQSLHNTKVFSVGDMFVHKTFLPKIFIEEVVLVMCLAKFFSFLKSYLGGVLY
jgi:hypothetical protein